MAVMWRGVENEQGVLIVYAVSEREHPTRLTNLDEYKHAAAYDKHLMAIQHTNNEAFTYVTSGESIAVKSGFPGAKAY